MKVLVIGGTASNPTQTERDYYQQYIDFFTRSAQNLSDETSVYAAMVEDLLIEVGDGVFNIFDAYNNKDISEYDVFFFRGAKSSAYLDVVATINEYADRHGIKMINNYSNIRNYSKLLQAARFEMLGAPVAKTLNVSSALIDHIDRIDGWQFPCIMKAKHGSHGNDNYVVHSIDEVREIKEANQDKSFVLQRFVPNDGDYRILIVGDETIVIGREAQDGSHLNNTSKGGVATEVAVDSLPEEVIAHAHTLARHFKMTIAGVDVLQDKETGKYSFLEINTQPQLMTGAFTDEKSRLLGLLLKQLEGTK